MSRYFSRRALLKWCALIILALLPCVILLACSKPAADVVEIKSYPIDNLDGILTGDGVAIDGAVSADGRGSLHVTAEKPVTIRLFETGDIDVENARLTYQARVKTDRVQGQAYLEMWCRFPGRGEYFSRSLHAPLSGTTDWTSVETPFFLKKGENPDNVKLNLVIAGTGSAWIDDVRLVRGPLQ